MGIIRKNHPHFVICSLHFSDVNAVSDICRIIYREMLLLQKNTSSAEKYVFFCQTLLFLSDAFYIMPPIPGAAAGAAGAGLRFINQHALCSQEKTSDRSRILQSHTLYLSRVNDTSLTHILVNILAGIVTEVAFTLAVLY